MTSFDETIVALATPVGIGAIGIVRISGSKAIEIVNSIFKGKNLTSVTTHSIHLGTLHKDNEIIDEVLLSLFKKPNSYTKEDVIEISSHGSPFILQKIIELIIEKGARLAKPGEFTQRAFINGRFDLAQAEAVADLISSENQAMQQAAVRQMRGGFSSEIKQLRKRLIHFASMIELEVDFSEEDVEFANRKDLEKLIYEIIDILQPLIHSFQWGNVIKNGVPVVIVGKPNAGKSTLLNTLLNEEKAIVSEIAGTTRDTIEESVTFDGITFRFIDTAGLRETEDQIEKMGVKRTLEKLKRASLILYILDLHASEIDIARKDLEIIKDSRVPCMIIGNKRDLVNNVTLDKWTSHYHILPISAENGVGIDELKKQIVKKIRESEVNGDQSVITNSRHFQALTKTRTALEKILESMDVSVTEDFLAIDIREALNHLGEITGEITTNDLLDNIFSKFCIGK